MSERKSNTETPITRQPHRRTTVWMLITDYQKLARIKAKDPQKLKMSRVIHQALSEWIPKHHPDVLGE